MYRNLELVGAFAPLEDLGDFGLDALFLVTDIAPPAPGPRLTRIRLPASAGAVELGWEGPGRVFQVQRALDVTGPYEALSEIVPDLCFNDPRPWTPQAFYRLQQW